MLAPSASGRAALVRQLLAYAAAPAGHGDAFPGRLDGIDDRQFQWLLDGGLGPLLHHATRGRPGQVPAAWCERLSSEEMTARLRHADRIDVACEVIDLCARHGESLTLLKGISTSEQFYPAAHLRPMADVDVLASVRSCRRIQSLLEAKGYRPRENCPDNDDQQHAPPLRHPTLGVWIEIHRRLFHACHELSAARVFATESLHANSESFTFHGLAARRLLPEIQLIYLAASWMRDLTENGLHPSFLASIFDATFLLRRAALDWTKLVALTGDAMPTASLHVLLSYLATRRVCAVPRELRDELAVRQKVVGPLQVHVIHAVLDRYLIGGRLWRHAFPPRLPDRYRIRQQWSRRAFR
jgi:putative nucleotidyltransferase-like protein